MNEELKFIQEEWRPVVDGHGLYEVSSLGRVRSTGHQTKAGFRKGRVLRLSPSSSGYLTFTMCTVDGRNTKAAHVAVCEAFHGPAEGREAAHRDGVKSDNRKDNLRWATRKENDEDKDVHGTRPRGDSHGQTKIPDALVPGIKAEYVRGSSTHGLKALAAKYGVSVQPIHDIVTEVRS